VGPCQVNHAEGLFEPAARVEPAAARQLESRLGREHSKNSSSHAAPAGIPAEAGEWRPPFRAEQRLRQKPVDDTRKPAVAFPSAVQQPHATGHGDGEHAELEKESDRARAQLAADGQRDEQRQVEREVRLARVHQVARDPSPRLEPPSGAAYVNQRLSQRRHRRRHDCGDGERCAAQGELSGHFPEGSPRTPYERAR